MKKSGTKNEMCCSIMLMLQRKKIVFPFYFVSWTHLFGYLIVLQVLKFMYQMKSDVLNSIRLFLLLLFSLVYSQWIQRQSICVASKDKAFFLLILFLLNWLWFKNGCQCCCRCFPGVSAKTLDKQYNHKCFSCQLFFIYCFD